MTPSFTHIPVLQSDVVVSGDPNVVFVTGLGSCVAACLFDPIAHVGGMNHFLLPYGEGEGQARWQFGKHAMQELVRVVLAAGAARENLVCKVFGGAAVVPLLDPIGEANSRFVSAYLAKAGIRCLAQSIGGCNARRLRFWPTSGRVQHSFITDQKEMRHILETEEPLAVVSKNLDYEFFIQDKNAP